MEDKNTGLEAVGEIRPLIEEIKKVKRQTRLLGWGLGLLILLVVAGWVGSIYSHFSSFDMEALGNEMAKKAERSWPLISEELNKLVDNILPVAEASIQKELEAAAPEISKAFETERKKLQEALNKDVERALKEHLVLKDRAEAVRIIQGAFPSFKDPKKLDQLVASLQDSFMKSTKKELLTMMARYYDTLGKFEQAFRKIKASTPEGQRPATLEAVLELWIELVYEKMGGDSQLEVSAPKAKGGKKGK